MTAYAIAKPAAIGEPRAARPGIGGRIALWVRRRVEQERTFNEMNALTDRELADLGFARCDLRRIAAEAAATVA
jgi:uncharacterized protein YjiS (DUF1127 family)